MTKKSPRLSPLLCIAILAIVFFGGLSFKANSAMALPRQTEEAPQQILTQSRHKLRDNHGKTWQVIFFQREKNAEVINLDLRLVGFPDVVSFYHPKPLTITTDKGKILTAEDKFKEQSPAPNVGEYDFKPIISQLSPMESITLALPDSASVTIPPAVILEWLDIAKK